MFLNRWEKFPTKLSYEKYVKSASTETTLALKYFLQAKIERCGIPFEQKIKLAYLWNKPQDTLTCKVCHIVCYIFKKLKLFFASNEFSKKSSSFDIENYI